MKVRYPPRRKRTENPCVAGSIPAHTTTEIQQKLGLFFMWYVYILYSKSGERTYVGFTNDIERRLREHNVSELKGFTLRYRPWQLIRKEEYHNKTEAMSIHPLSLVRSF